MKRFVLFIAFVMMLALLTINLPFITPVHAADDIKVYVDNNQVSFPDQKPFIDNNTNRTFVPLRFVSEALGCQVDWDSETQTAIVKREGTDIQMNIGSANPLVNGSAKTLDTPARMVNQRTMVPLRFVSEALGEYVDWDGKTRTVYISNVLREVTDPVNDNDTEDNNYPGGYRPIDGGGGTSTKPADDTPPIPWGN